MPRAPWDAAGLPLDPFLGLSLGVRVRLLASCFLDWGYHLTKPHTPFLVPGAPVGLASETNRVTNCSTMTTAIVIGCYPDELGEDGDAYGELQVYAEHYKAGILDSPILAVERCEVGKRVTRYIEGRWALVLGWRRLGDTPSGHAFLVYPDGDGLLVLEAASGGPRWRRTTEKALAAEYPAGRYAAALNE